MFQFMLHRRRMKFDCCKFWVGYNLELLHFKTFYLISVTFTSWLIMVIKYECYNFWNAFNIFIFRLYKAMYVVFVRETWKIYRKKHLCSSLANG